MNPYGILAEKSLGKEPLERQSSEITFRTYLRGIHCTDIKRMELGRSGSTAFRFTGPATIPQR